MSATGRFLFIRSFNYSFLGTKLRIQHTQVMVSRGVHMSTSCTAMNLIKIVHINKKDEDQAKKSKLHSQLIPTKKLRILLQLRSNYTTEVHVIYFYMPKYWEKIVHVLHRFVA